MIRAHQQQLDEMASLCFKEEHLINQMSGMVSALDEDFTAHWTCIIDLEDS